MKPAKTIQALRFELAFHNKYNENTRKIPSACITSNEYNNKLEKNPARILTFSNEYKQKTKKLTEYQRSPIRKENYQS